MRSLLTLVLVALLAHGSVAEAASRADFATMSAEEVYTVAVKQMRRGLYDRAIEAFQHVRNFHRDDPLSVKAQLALADIRFDKGDFEEARYAYEEFATYHPRHEAMDHVTYRVGLCIYKRAAKVAGRDQTTTRAAVNKWTGYANRYPDSANVEQVEKYLARGRDRLAAAELFVARFYAKRGSWRAVEGRTRSLLRLFGDSQHAEEALMLAAKAYHGLGRATEAASARERLAEQYPESRLLAQLDKRLAKPLGKPPEDETFVRPYRLPGGGQQTPGQ